MQGGITDKKPVSGKLNYKLFGSDKLNLGSGFFKKKGFVNVDIDTRMNPDLVHNLDEMPYPFDDKTFSLIEADHVLEHLTDPLGAMRELHRIIKDDGLLVVRVPHMSRGFTHPDHKRGFDISFPFYFDEKFEMGYCGSSFKLKRIRFKWFAQPYLKKKILPGYKYYIGLISGNIFDFFANLFPYFCSRIWCYWVGGFEEIEFIFTK